MMYGMFGFGLVMLLVMVVPLVLVVVLIAAASGWFGNWNRNPVVTQNQPLPSSPPVVYTPTTPQAERYCSHCAAGLKSDWTYCPQCGAPVQ